MARLDTSGLDDLIAEMERMGQSSGDVAEAMVNAAAVVIRDAWKETAEKYGLHDTGDMIRSIGFPTPPQKIGAAIFRDVYPQGKDSKGVRNAEKAFLLHYGTSRIKAKYWVDEAEAISGPRVQERLEEIWGEFLETGKIPTTIDSVVGANDEGITTKTK